MQYIDSISKTKKYLITYVSKPSIRQAQPALLHLRHAYMDVGKGRELGAVSFAYMDVGKGRELGA